LFNRFKPIGHGRSALTDSAIHHQGTCCKRTPSIELNSSTGSRRGASAGMPADPNMIVVGVWMLEPDEDSIVARRLHEVLSKAARA
jgi:hypothetical protein